MNALIYSGSWQAITSVCAARLACKDNLSKTVAFYMRRDNEPDMLQCTRKYLTQLGVDATAVKAAEVKCGILQPDFMEALESANRVILPLSLDFTHLKSWPESVKGKLFFYEDGMQTSFILQNFQTNENRKKQISFRGWVYHLLRRKKGGEIHIGKTSHMAAYYGILDFDGMPRKENLIHTSDLNAEIERFRIANGEGKNSDITYGTVLLGTNLSTYGIISADQEFGAVCDFISNQPEGEPIYWKPHPRAAHLYTEYLMGKFSHLRLWPNSDGAIPFECGLPDTGDLHLASVMSTGLVYAKELHGMKVSLIGDIEPALVASTRSGHKLESYRYLRQRLAC